MPQPKNVAHNLLSKNLFSNGKKIIEYRNKHQLEAKKKKKFLIYSQKLIPVRVQEQRGEGRGASFWWNVTCAMHSDFPFCICLKLHLATSPSQADLPSLPCSWFLLPWGRCELETLGPEMFCLHAQWVTGSVSQSAAPCSDNFPARRTKWNLAYLASPQSGREISVGVFAHLPLGQAFQSIFIYDYCHFQGNYNTPAFV